MAAGNGKKGYRIRFELSLPGLLGVGVVCFCIFLWMFLLGLWAGQSGLISGLSISALPAIPAAAKVEPKGKQPESPEVDLVSPASPPKLPETPAPVAAGEPAAPEEAPAPAAPPPEPGAQAPQAPRYTIQVGAFRDSRYAEEAVQKWRAKGLEVFSRPPAGGNEHLTKVYAGRFAEAEEARKEAASLAEKEKITPLVVAIPAEDGKRP